MEKMRTLKDKEFKELSISMESMRAKMQLEIDSLKLVIITKEGIILKLEASIIELEITIKKFVDIEK